MKLSEAAETRAPRAPSAQDEERYPALPQRAVGQRARSRPEDKAVISPAGDRTWAELDARVNQLVRALRSRGLQSGDAVALVCSNRPEFVETYVAALRAGLRLTPINWHLSGPEMAYIASDCEAAAFVGDARFAGACAEAAHQVGVRLAVGGDIEGFDSYEAALQAESPEDIPDPGFGNTMLYTSGTTGRPKGVFRKRAARSRLQTVAATHQEGDLYLCTGPLYHAAPLAFSLGIPLMWGVGVVLMDGWDPEETLELIERHRITHTHMVPIMFHRLLALPEDVRNRYDLSSLRRIAHGAAPCPVEVKRALIEWMGPIVWEYYAATEGSGTSIESDEWLRKPGSVGQTPEPGHIEIRGPHGEPMPPGEVGTVYLRAPEEPETRFQYFKDEDKTAGAYAGDYFTLGDMGYVDEDGYLFLTDRSADLIISGGVNIYPAEVDAVLLTHPAVADSCTIGLPNAEWGEEVKGVVQLRKGLEPSEKLAAELIEHCRQKLAHFKCPRTVSFLDELPRHETGKLYRRLVRDRFREEADGNL